jgi:flagellar hook-length control protein FliK
MNAAAQAQPAETMFTTILKRGIAVNMKPDAMIALSPCDIPLALHMDEAEKAGEAEEADVCTQLLAQLLAMSPGSRADGGESGPADGAEKAVNGVQGVIGQLAGVSADTTDKGLANAASAILGNDGKAAEVLGALAADKAGEITGNGEAAASDAAFKTVLAGIGGALRNEMNRNEADGNTMAATAVAAGAVTAAADDEAAAERDNRMGRVSSPAFQITADENAMTADQSGTKKTGRSDEVRRTDYVASSEGTAEDVQAGVYSAKESDDGRNAGSGGEGGFGGLTQRDESKNDASGAAESGVSRVLSSTGATDITAETADISAGEKAAAAERALSSFAEDMRSFRGGSREIRIVLEPESLGVLTISVLKTENGISAKIKSEDKEVAAIISEQVHRLISSMESKGITVNDVDVAYSQPEQSTGFTQQGFSQARDESSKGHAAPGGKNPGEEATNTEIWQTLYGGEAGSDATVEYRV